MKILRTVEELIAWRGGLPAGERIAFVPTMGYLHEGHLSLMRKGRELVPVGEGPSVISIFVNPTQFDPGEDLDRYPRDEASDLAAAAEAGVDVAFCPTENGVLYAEDAATWVTVPALDNGILCAKSRPNHFRGVCTVVTKLWNLVRPDYGIFGAKDYQQLAIIRRMHRDLFLCGEVVGMPIVREPDGVAMSSRNANLSPESRLAARKIPAALDEVERRLQAGKTATASLTEGVAEMVRPGVLDYVEVRDAASLELVDDVDREVVVALAVQFPGARLLDNRVLRP